ncbi:MAG TPA: chromosome segregation SMC family protein [Nitrososphaerales archaeon]|nr:chromosome segregation SMC family protein [Nitrososphaerales archaeon]
MVYLKKIETKGFKSMGSKVISVPVERGFVAITGPNGSGKSNLLDAILFALGENSAKTLRVPNLGALIYDGSVEEQKPSSAKVSLQFDNSDRRIPIDSDSVTISREMKASGESIYTLNGKHVQRNNLSELLEMALIASRGLNVVLQGMITRISELVPDEKRKLIEQMVGVAQFDEKKNQAMSQLKEADMKLEVAMARIGEIRDRVQRLEQERNDQLRMKQLEEETGWLRAATTSARLANVRRVILQKRENAAELGTKLQQLQSHLAEVTASIETLDRERTQLIKTAMDAGSAKVQLEVSKLEGEIDALKRERQEATDLLDRVRQIIPTLKQMSAGQENRIAQAEAQVSVIQQKISDAEKKKLDFVVELDKVGRERTAFEREYEQAQSKLVWFRKLKDSADFKLNKAREELTRLGSEMKLLEERKVSLHDKMKFYSEALVEARKNISGLENLLQSQRGELVELHESRASVEALRKKVEEQLELALLILEKAQLAVTRYDSDLSAMESIAGEEFALTRLESLGESSALRGYLGPLRSLVQYEPVYSEAIAALGRDWLNAVVVEDMPALIRVTEASKKLKIGRLTAIPLKEVSDLETEERIRPFEGMVASVVDVVSCESRLKGLLNFIFGDSVIVESAKYAFMAARRGFRAVTLQGDIFEPEVFAFETGYSKKYAKITSLLSQQETFEGIKTALASLRAAIDKRKVSISKLHSKSENFQKTEAEHDLNISKIESKLDTTKQFVARYSDHAASYDERLKETEHEIHKLKRRSSANEKLVRALELGSQKLSEVLSKFDLSYFNSRSAEITRKRSDIDSRIELIRSEIGELTTELTRTRGDLENSQKPALERLRQQLSETEANSQAKTKFLTDSEAKLAELESNLKALKEREADTLEKASRFQPTLDALDAKIKTLKIEEESVRKAINSADRELFTANAELSRQTENERILLGELAMYGYGEPIESFEGADILLKELQIEYDSLRNSVNLLADRSYREVFENYKYSSVRKNELEKERNAIVTFIETIDAEKRKVFMDAFERIDKEIRVIFSKITNGSAWLELEKPDSIFDSGVFLMAQFPGKLPRDSSSVSGGEKTISALSFILAIQAVFPSPFYVFDEVDAHLDSVYSGRLADVLSERTNYSQIIIVSLKDTVVSKAQSVIGVYMSQGSSRVIRYRSGMEVELRNEQR